MSLPDIESKNDTKKSLKYWLFEKTTSSVYNEVRGLLYAFMAAMVIRTFWYQPFNIPSGSMYPTLMVGDFLFCNKYVYGLSNESFPLRPNLYKGRVFDGVVKRGDVVVFNNPKDKENRDFIKRCVGLPGDRIQVKQGVLHINGQAVRLERQKDYIWNDIEGGRVYVVPHYKEYFPGDDKGHFILKHAGFEEMAQKRPMDNTPEYVVPENHYFMMGDNRDHSGDSRLMDSVGFVHKDTIIGRADFLFFSTEAHWNEVLKWIPGARLERIFTPIK